MIKRYITYTALGFILMLGWNIFLIQRDQKLFKAYDACTQSTQHPNCPYQK
jgi:hypothetical protein